MRCPLIVLLFIVGTSAFPTPTGSNEIRRGAPYTPFNSTHDYKWPTDKVISYTFIGDYENDFALNIVDAFQFYADNTCLTFEEDGPTTPLIRVQGDYSTCWSNVGRQDDDWQTLSLHSGCNSKGTIAHEIGHTIGLDHTMARFDRDDYIQINFTNMKPGSEKNYKKREQQDNNNFGVPYDYGSLMHYSGYTYALDMKNLVIKAKDELSQSSMGMNFRPAFSDLKMINALYKCADKCLSPSVKCQNSGIINPKKCNTCICPYPFSGADCSKRHPGRGVNASTPICGADATATSDWQNVKGSFGLVNEEYDLSECFWIIKAPAGRKIEIRLNKGDFECNNTCNWTGMEVFAKGFVVGGYKFCCKDKYVGKVIQSQDNLAAVGIFSYRNTPKYDFDYRFV